MRTYTCPYCKSNKTHYLSDNWSKRTVVSDGYELYTERPIPPKKPNWLDWTLIFCVFGYFFNLLVVPFMLACVWIVITPSREKWDIYHDAVHYWNKRMVCEKCTKLFTK